MSELVNPKDSIEGQSIEVRYKKIIFKGCFNGKKFGNYYKYKGTRKGTAKILQEVTDTPWFGTYKDGGTIVRSKSVSCFSKEKERISVENQSGRHKTHVLITNSRTACQIDTPIKSIQDSIKIYSGSKSKNLNQQEDEFEKTLRGKSNK